MIFWRSAWAELKRHRGRSLLSLLSVVIAVAAIVAVTAATATTRQSFDRVFKSLAGGADLEIISRGGFFEQSLAAPVSDLPHVRAVTPIFRRGTIAIVNKVKVKVLISGLVDNDPESIRGYEFKSGKLPEQPDEVALEEGVAASLHVAVGDEVKLLAGGLRPNVFHASGIFAVTQGTEAIQGGMILAPLESLQKVFRSKNRVNAVHVYLDDPQKADEVIAKATDLLPSQLEIAAPAARSGLAEETVLLTSVGLNMASALSMTTAIFVVLSVCLMNVSERRRQFSIMSAIGATRRQIMEMICFEAIVLGAVGTVFGIPLGIEAAALISEAMAGVLGVSMPGAPDLRWPIAAGAVLGPLSCLIASWYPARKASQVSPLEGMQPVVTLEPERGHAKSTITGVILLAITVAAAIGAANGALPVWAAVLSLIVGLVSGVFLMPVTLAPGVWLMVGPIRPLLGIVGSMAERLVLRHSTRNALTAGVLFMGVSTGLATGNAVFSINNDIHSWYVRTISADFLLRAMMPDMSGQEATRMPESMAETIAAFDGVKQVESLYFRRADVGGQEVLFIAREFEHYPLVPLAILEADEAKTRQRLLDGQIALGSAVAQRLKVKAGDKVEVTLGDIKHTFEVATLCTDYTSGGSILYVERKAAEQAFNLQGIDTFLIQAQPGRVADVQPQLDQLATENSLLLQSFADLANFIEGAVSSLNSGLWVLLTLGLLVGALGVANTLTMNVLEQTRELGMLSAIGMRRSQIIKTVLGQSVIIGLVGIVSGCLCGAALSKMINICLGSLFGRFIPYAINLEFIGAVAGMAMAIVVLSALLPARRAATLSPIEAMRVD